MRRPIVRYKTAERYYELQRLLLREICSRNNQGRPRTNARSLGKLGEPTPDTGSQPCPDPITITYTYTRSQPCSDAITITFTDAGSYPSSDTSAYAIVWRGSMS